MTSQRVNGDHSAFRPPMRAPLGAKFVTAFGRESGRFCHRIPSEATPPLGGAPRPGARNADRYHPKVAPHVFILLLCRVGGPVPRCAPYPLEAPQTLNFVGGNPGSNVLLPPSRQCQPHGGNGARCGRRRHSNQHSRVVLLAITGAASLILTRRPILSLVRGGAAPVPS